ncbi:GGDEF domain-containing protein [Motilibacter deserti]|uniref:GGDEF domain-containing protein n=1 Tax=Motilibacter deserti TaxID=2714956 RepID=A0ABX0GTU6_9ACTN|nr:GGDEF domain-containing protein [Motilibacter deserti]NHC13126.1 GGDEF domain-containing protein [Motilibacter deserti]
MTATAGALDAGPDDLRPLRLAPARLGAGLVLTCAALVLSTHWLLSPGRQLLVTAAVAQVVALGIAALALLLPWRTLPPVALLGFPVLGMAALAVTGMAHGSAPINAAYNGLFTLAATYAGLTQSRRAALAFVPAMLPLYVLSNGGVSGPLLARLPGALTVWTLLALLLADFAARHRRNGMLLRREADTDALTGLHNRRRLDVDLGLLQPGDAVTMLDLDHFKRLNDTLGHAGGDAVLSQFGSAVRAVLRQRDVAYRYGGEEVMLVLPETSSGEAARLVERLSTVWSAACPGVTFSGGVATRTSGERPQDTAARADHALYEAKRRGRDRVLMHEPPHLDVPTSTRPVPLADLVKDPAAAG